MKLIFSLVVLISNILLCVNSFEISVHSTVNTHKQNSFKKGDNVKITCDITKTKDVSKVTLKHSEVTVFEWVYGTVDKKGNFTIKDSGFSDPTEDKVESEQLSISANINNVTEKIAGPYKCLVIDNGTSSDNVAEIKFWGGDIENTDISIYKDNKTKTITDFHKGESFIIECSQSNVRKGNIKEAKLHHVKLLQNDNEVMNFKFEDTLKIDENWAKYGINPDKYKTINDTGYGVHVHDAFDKIKGTYKCEYLVDLGSNFSYYTVTHEKEIKYNYGLKTHLSASLIIISFITLLLNKI